MSDLIKVVGEASKISISFWLTLLDGTFVEGTDEDECLEFTIGDGTFLSSLETLLVGLEEETRAKFTLPPESAFGHHDPSNIQSMPKNAFSEDMALEIDQVIGFTSPTGEEFPGRIVKIDESSVEVDFNHPLAGHSILFEAKILKIFS